LTGEVAKCFLCWPSTRPLAIEARPRRLCVAQAAARLSLPVSNLADVISSLLDVKILREFTLIALIVLAWA